MLRHSNIYFDHYGHGEGHMAWCMFTDQHFTGVSWAWVGLWKTGGGELAVKFLGFHKGNVSCMMPSQRGQAMFTYFSHNRGWFFSGQMGHGSIPLILHWEFAFFNHRCEYKNGGWWHLATRSLDCWYLAKRSLDCWYLAKRSLDCWWWHQANVSLDKSRNTIQGSHLMVYCDI